ncbi:MAG: VOC family protein [Acidobacteria bacterium]|nr:VOC family protein [Acidobacteriota bacterium]
MNNAITWFEIPTVDIQRARAFYETVLDKSLRTVPKAEPVYLFPHDVSAVGGSLIQRKEQQPSGAGVTVYLRVEGSVREAEQRVAPAGGTVLVPEMSIPGVPGTLFVLKDTEGNCVGIHGGF